MKPASFFHAAPNSLRLILTGLLLIIPGLIAIPAFAASPCGGLNQRACCVTERPGQPCNQGLHEQLGCSGDCTCGGANPFGALNSVGRCVPNPQPTPCGAPGQRACCVTERIPSCNAGAHEEPGCNGNCMCGGPNPGGLLKAIGHCVANPVINPCGGPNQRACCVTERPGQPCNQGLHEELGCSGNCTCGGPNPAGALKAVGHCVPNPTITACGGPNQRACCVTERPGQPCNQGFHEEPGCNGNCICGGPNPAWKLKAVGHCVPNATIAACGGPNQRACCVTERPGQPCNQGLREVPGCSGNCICGGPNPVGVLKSIGHCEPQACGGPGQRACCVTERPLACDPGSLEIPGCSGDCKCGGANPLGVLNAISHCENGCSAAIGLINKLESDLAKARNHVKQFCGQGGATAAPQPPQQQMMQAPQQMLAPQQLLKR